MSTALLVDDDLVTQATTFRSRAEALRREADGLNEVAATAFRRRAAELELEAWILEVQSGRPVDEITTAA
jgi:hypothetical protein